MGRLQNDHTKFDIDKTIQPFFSGGNVALSENGLILATSLGEDALLTFVPAERQICKIEGVGHAMLQKYRGF